MSTPLNSHLITLMLLATLMLRAAIPDGYMPASKGSGLLFELCPSGVPAELMLAVSGSSQHHHHGAEEGQSAHFDAADCPIGHLLSATVAFDDFWQDSATPVASVAIEFVMLVPATAARVARRSRGPPA